MLRTLGLAVAISIVVLFVAVSRSQPSTSAHAEGSRPATQARRSVNPPRRTPHRIPPRPALPERVDPSDPGERPEGPEHAELETGPRPPIDPVPAAGPEAYTPTYEDQRVLERAVAFFDSFVSAIENNAGSCDRMADALEAVIRNNKGLIAESASMKGDPERERWFQQQSQTLLMPKMNRIMEPLQGCISNPRMVEVLSRMNPA